MSPVSTAKVRQGERSREAILDSTERLMADRGYAATSIAAICADCGLPAPSIYWHFDSKDGVLAAVMERGANRWFAELPRWEDVEGPPDERVGQLLTAGADAVSSHPAFLRLFYMLALDESGDELAAELIRRVRRSAFEQFRAAIVELLGEAYPPQIAAAATDELTRFAVAFSDGAFFANQLEPDDADLRRMYSDLGIALAALAPIVVARLHEGVSNPREGTA